MRPTYLRLYNHGLWPENSYEDYIDRFQVRAELGRPRTEGSLGLLLLPGRVAPGMCYWHFVGTGCQHT